MVLLGMERGITFSVTMIWPGAVPFVEVGAYEYVGLSLPSVGETITVRKAGGGGGLHGYVTRVAPSASAPISVTGVPASVES
jgi:hypothetical protein